MTDRSTVQLVIWWLGGLAAILTAGLVAAVLLKLSIPDPMWSLVSTLYGALAALLVSVRSGPSEPAPVEVTNTADDPVGVEEAAEPVPIADAPRSRKKRINPGPRRAGLREADPDVDPA